MEPISDISADFTVPLHLPTYLLPVFHRTKEVLSDDHYLLLYRKNTGSLRVASSQSSVIKFAASVSYRFQCKYTDRSVRPFVLSLILSIFLPFGYVFGYESWLTVI